MACDPLESCPRPPAGPARAASVVLAEPAAASSATSTAMAIATVKTDPEGASGPAARDVVPMP